MDRTRTQPQAEAARRNGRLSAGPASPIGKMKVSSNGVVHGLRSERVVLAHEDPGAYTEHVQLWIDTLRPVDEAELEVVVSIADCRWRLKRLDQVEMNRQRAEVLAQIEETPEHAYLRAVENVATATAAMHDVISSLPGLDSGSASLLMPAVRQVIGSLEALERDRIGLRLGSKSLDEAVGRILTQDSESGIAASALQGLKSAAAESMTAIREEVTIARGTVDKLKERLAATVPLPDGKQQTLMNRYRRDIERRLASEMSFLAAVRDRKLQAEATAGLLGRPIPVSIRLVG